MFVEQHPNTLKTLVCVSGIFNKQNLEDSTDFT